MPVVKCPHCSKPVSLPDPWTGAAFTCPHCHRLVATAPAAPPPPPPPAQEEFEIEPEPRSRFRRRPSGSAAGDFLTFRQMITPVIIQIIFWVGVLGCVWMGVKTIVSSFQEQPDLLREAEFDRRDFGRPGFPDPVGVNAKPGQAAARHFSPSTFALGVAILTLGPLIIRVLCELDIILFKIHEELKTANDRQRYRR